MKKIDLKFLAVIVCLTFIFVSLANAILINDGDFSAWDFGATGAATVSREVAGGNPGARLNVTTISGSFVLGTAVKSDFSTIQPLAGTSYNLNLDVLSGPGAYGQGQYIALIVEQNFSIYTLAGGAIGVTGYPLNWDTISVAGSFTENSFVLRAGAGPTNPDFSGGIETFFGFAAGNVNSGTLTQYYDNFSLDIQGIPSTPVPDPVSIDIIPKTCPNECPIKGSGFVNVAVLGTQDFDVTTIDTASIRLVYTIEDIKREVAPARSSIKDVSGPPFEQPIECECITDGKDGFDDLVLKFDKQEVINTLDIPAWETLMLRITGVLQDGTPIEGEDCLKFIYKGGH